MRDVDPKKETIYGIRWGSRTFECMEIYLIKEKAHKRARFIALARKSMHDKDFYIFIVLFKRDKKELPVR